ncbi:hypothetical protein BGZ83_003263, partial [Gryganskiella cystojenkinii]
MIGRGKYQKPNYYDKKVDSKVAINCYGNDKDNDSSEQGSKDRKPTRKLILKSTESAAGTSRCGQERISEKPLNDFKSIGHIRTYYEMGLEQEEEEEVDDEPMLIRRRQSQLKETRNATERQVTIIEVPMVEDGEAVINGVRQQGQEEDDNNG